MQTVSSACSLPGCLGETFTDPFFFFLFFSSPSKAVPRRGSVLGAALFLGGLMVLNCIEDSTSTISRKRSNARDRPNIKSLRSLLT